MNPALLATLGTLAETASLKADILPPVSGENAPVFTLPKMVVAAVAERVHSAKTSQQQATHPQENDPVAMQALTRPWWSPARWSAGRPRFGLPQEGGVQMLWANMALHMASDPQALIAQWHRALSVDGYLMFSCLGPDTAKELHAVYAALGWPPAGHAFTDMHDWGDMLVQAGFAEPVMDMERIRLTFATPQRLLQELAELGCNLHPQRFPALRGRHWRRRLHEVLQDKLGEPDEGGQLALTFEIIYGHAYKPKPRVRVSASSAVSLEDMRAMLREGSSKG